MARLDIYRLTVEETEEGMDFVGLVDSPAHSKKWITMSKAPKKVERYHFNEEKKIVSGVVLSTYQPIYRVDSTGYEYNVYFTKEDSIKIRDMFARKGYHNNVNLMHDLNQKVDNIGLIEMITVNDEKSNIPEAFANQNLQKGSLIFSYKVYNDKAWKFIKENGTGFSLEGWFKEVEVKLQGKKPIKKTSKMSKSIWEKFGLQKPGAKKAVFDSENKDKYAEAVTVDGVTIMWDGALEAGTPIFMVPEEGEPILMEAGEISFDFEGNTYLVNVDENGAITTVEVVEEMDEEMAEAVEAMAAKFAAQEKSFNERFDAFKKANDEKTAELQKSVDTLTEAVEKIAENVEFKTQSSTTTNSGGSGWRGLKKK